MMKIVQGIERKIQKHNRKLNKEFSKMEKHIVALRHLPSLNSPKLSALEESLVRLKDTQGKMTKSVDQLVQQFEQIEQDREQDLIQITSKKEEHLSEIITQQLDNHDFPYSYATVMWSAEALWQIEHVRREIIKNILRDYFAPKGLKFDGWNASHHINPAIESISDPKEYAKNLLQDIKFQPGIPAASEIE